MTLGEGGGGGSGGIEREGGEGGGGERGLESRYWEIACPEQGVIPPPTLTPCLEVGVGGRLLTRNKNEEEGDEGCGGGGEGGAGAGAGAEGLIEGSRNSRNSYEGGYLKVQLGSLSGAAIVTLVRL